MTFFYFSREAYLAYIITQLLLIYYIKGVSFAYRGLPRQGACIPKPDTKVLHFHRKNNTFVCQFVCHLYTLYAEALRFIGEKVGPLIEHPFNYRVSVLV